MKRTIMTIMMAMVMIFTAFGSICGNAANRDVEIEEFTLDVEDGQYYRIGEDSDFRYAMINEFTILDENRDVIRTVNAMAMANAYAKYYGLTNKNMFTLVGPMIFKEKQDGKDLGMQFGYVAFENGKIVFAHEFITIHEIEDNRIMSEVISYL